MAKPIDPEEYQRLLDKLSGVFSDIVKHADVVSQQRCPYKNRRDECTAKFGCRNQRKPRTPGGLKICGGDEKLDYRNAWETEPEFYDNLNKDDSATD